MLAPKLDALRSKSRADLEALYDRHTDNVVLGLDFIRREIEWRVQAEFAERTEQMTKNVEAMTAEIRDMTKSIQRLTLTAVIVAAASIVVSLVSLLR